VTGSMGAPDPTVRPCYDRRGWRVRRPFQGTSPPGSGAWRLDRKPLAWLVSAGMLRTTSFGALLLLSLAACGSNGGGVPSPTPSGSQAVDYVESIRNSAVTFEMVWVPAGEFWMGRHEVTWDEYLLYCDFEEAGKVPPGVDAVTKPSKPLDDVAPFDRDWGTGRRPAVGMSWKAAQKYCEWLSLNTGRTYRLPTEAEWELACGSDPMMPLSDHAWHYENSGLMTQEVGRLEPNAAGLHDILGNLWEYCRDPFSPAEPDRAVLRGGSWRTKASAMARGARLGFEESWNMLDPNVPPGVWWVPDGNQLGMRVLRSK